MIQGARDSLVHMGIGVVGLCVSLAVQAHSLTPVPPMSAAAGAGYVAAEVGQGAGPLAAGAMLLWGPLLVLLVGLLVALGILIWRQRAAGASTNRPERVRRVLRLATGATRAAEVRGWHGVTPTPRSQRTTALNAPARRPNRKARP